MFYLFLHVWPCFICLVLTALHAQAVAHMHVSASGSLQATRRVWTQPSAGSVVATAAYSSDETQSRLCLLSLVLWHGVCWPRAF